MCRGKQGEKEQEVHHGIPIYVVYYSKLIFQSNICLPLVPLSQNKIL
jgi:hypothetical protein